MNIGTTQKILIEAINRQNTITTKYEVDGELLMILIHKHQYFIVSTSLLEFYPINLTVSYGRQLIVWGQLEIFSPVDFLLPIDFNPSGLSLSKADNRMPQTTVCIVLPFDNLELTGYYFPNFEESDLYSSYDFLIDDESLKSCPLAQLKWRHSSHLVSQQFTAALPIIWVQYFPIFKEKYTSYTNENYKSDYEFGYYKKYWNRA